MKLSFELFNVYDLQYHLISWCIIIKTVMVYAYAYKTYVYGRHNVGKVGAFIRTQM